MLQVAKEIGADEIIVGIWKTFPIGKLLFGSPDQEIILKAECPVLITI